MFNKNQAGLALGSLFGLMHLLWIIVVALGNGQSLVNKLHNIHFLSKEVTLLDFNFSTAILGVILAFISGYIIAWVFVYFWNLFTKK